jgi:predicted transcriptional regulator
MNRTTLSLPDDLASALKREARRRHTSVSSVAREALSDHFGLTGVGPREVPFAAIGRSTDGRTARESDEILAEIVEDAYQDAFDGRRR